MKLSFLIGAAAGYVLGARAGRERYESIVRLAHQVTGSQTVQATAGVLKAQADELTKNLRGTVDRRLSHTLNGHGANGHKTH